MGNTEFTTSPHAARLKCESSTYNPHASEHANANDAQPEYDNMPLITPLEEALEEERTQLMLANSMLGCLQIALDPEAITVTPPVYFPEVLELARQFINNSVRRLEYDEIRRLMRGSMRCDK
jgi:hypothetical protein